MDATVYSDYENDLKKLNDKNTESEDIVLSDLDYQSQVNILLGGRFNTIVEFLNEYQRIMAVTPSEEYINFKDKAIKKDIDVDAISIIDNVIENGEAFFMAIYSDAGAKCLLNIDFVIGYKELKTEKEQVDYIFDFLEKMQYSSTICDKNLAYTLSMLINPIIPKLHIPEPEESKNDTE